MEVSAVDRDWCRKGNVHGEIMACRTSLLILRCTIMIGLNIYSFSLHRHLTLHLCDVVHNCNKGLYSTVFISVTKSKKVFFQVGLLL